jgi:hypothetical protein
VNDSEWETKGKTRCEERGLGKGQNERRTRVIKKGAQEGKEETEQRRRKNRLEKQRTENKMNKINKDERGDTGIGTRKGNKQANTE